MTTPATWHNWAGNQICAPAESCRPTSVDELRAALARAAAARHAVRVVGAGHSFTAAVATDGTMLDLAAMPVRFEADAASGLVTVSAGMRLHELNRRLWDVGLAMRNLGDIDRQTLAGAVSTGTHGTGAKLGGLATQIRALEIMLADGSLVHCSPDENAELYDAGRVSVGALGVITAITLQCDPAYVLRAEEGPMPLARAMADFEHLAAANDHFEFFWFPHTDAVMSKQNNRMPVSAPVEASSRIRDFVEAELLGNVAFGAICETGRRVPSLIPVLARRSVRLLGERVYHAPAPDVFASPRRVRFVEMEYSVPRERVADGLDAIRDVIDRLDLRVSFPVEVRVSQGDDIPLSTASGRDSAYLAIHMYKGTPGYERYFRAVEERLTEMAGRPHWGKLHYRTSDSLAEQYPRWNDFQTVRDKYDPDRLFTNSYVRRVLG